MLVALGFLMVATFMALIMTKRMTPLLALILVPTIFGIFTGAGFGLGDMIMDAIKDMSGTAALLMFAIMYFGIMIDVGLFDRLVAGIQKLVGNDPAKVVLGTSLLTAVISLDGDGSTTFIVVTAALLPIYQRLGMSPVVLTCVAGLTNGTLNIVPWGGPTARAAAALHVDAADVFVPMLPSLGIALVVIGLFAWQLGVSERRRLQRERPELWGTEMGGGNITSPSGGKSPAGTAPSGGHLAVLEAVARKGDGSEPATMDGTVLDPNRETLRPKTFYFNLVLTVAIMVLLVVDVLPLSYLFMVGTAIALVVNFPKVSDQVKMIAGHSSEIIAVVSMVLGAAVLTGVLSGTGMVDAMSQWLVAIIPDSLGPSMAVITGLISIPATFLMSNDAFYFGILPVLTEAGAHFGVPAVDMARASITGQPVHMQSPLVPAILLLVSLSRVDLGDHHKKVLWRALVVALVMLVSGVLLGAIHMG
ncbi:MULTISPECIES: CitMHS family transporter [Glutamicibacter]|uniref:SLC13 family permease n=1 Tax=Glutamicibacter halophytocola TaxID=1933880 RepID=A0AA94XZ27_9MICC|nr:MULTISPECIES: SLC13 family permease [Glutamicibacter]MBF6671986.1 citrate:proton symporter [Glutamicibacter sp. FBE19]NQD42082.1 citrate:proton symporter [Glutamicibacter halophytocola]UUX59390.1 SLC13 family permease [Glutamicibacter halophytocola]